MTKLLNMDGLLCLTTSLLIIFFSLMFTVNIVFAHPPSGMNLSYDGETRILTVVINHRVGNKSNHFVDQVVLTKNGEKILEESYNEQDTTSGAEFKYEIPAENGDTLTVTTQCNRFGQITRSIEVKGVPVEGKVLLQAKLVTSTEVPAVADTTPGAASGIIIAILDREMNVLRYSLTYKGLSDTPTMAHFHRGPSGETGPPVRTIFGKPQIEGSPEDAPNGTSAFISGSWTGEGEQPLTDELEEAILSGNIYVNIHTELNKGGEIRGQLQQLNDKS
ncbi:CHRD domain-containing protein [Candidatus Bipolaricaulota bacterium]|nr:CHRD domain-containing protein [Candidatus Bipolaricaulota bacterium]MBS3825957.1 CHRD domain-containing protein [Candidatus Bipolaricaulota bacterium]